MKESIESLRTQFVKELAQAVSSTDLEALRVKFLGKKSSMQELMRGLRDLSPEEKPLMGQLINEMKDDWSEKIESQKEAFIVAEEDQRLRAEAIDLTLPGRKSFSGNKHIISHTLDRIIDLFVEMGFSVQYGPDIDTDYYNFEALNFPPDHPARDMQDTFYIAPGVLLRTHTSNVQVRAIEESRLPIRIIAPGKAYRNEAITARSHVFFHQVEGLYIDQEVTFSDLMATMRVFFQRFFQQELEVRFRPSYFPFVEPGMEVDIRCCNCKGSGCFLCKQAGWLEVAGAGMVHPEVLKNGGIDPEVYSGYAWGLGIERLTMLCYGISDIRLFTENDLRFLKQFHAV